MLNSQVSLFFNERAFIEVLIQEEALTNDIHEWDPLSIPYYDPSSSNKQQNIFTDSDLFPTNPQLVRTVATNTKCTRL